MILWLSSVVFCQPTTDFKIGIGGISWKESAFAARSVPGIHTCSTRRLSYSYSLQENQVLLNSSNNTVGPSNVHSLDHCTLWLTNPEIARWKSIAAKPSAPYYHFFVNGCMQQLPVLNGSHFFTQWLVVIDPNVDDFCPRFEVAGVSMYRF
jgi:hypothetical protein